MNDIQPAPDERVALGVIPARYASTRFPGKPLADICGKPMIQRVWEAARQARCIQRLVVATDDERIAAVCREFGAEALLTPSSLASGADRVAYAADFYTRQSGKRFPIVLNIQGDEPLLEGALLDELVAAFLERRQAAADKSLVVTTPVQRIISPEELFSPHCVKAALDESSKILHFSRSPIPRTAAFSSPEAHLEADLEADIDADMERHIFWKHIGLYAYSADALAAFAALPPSPLEQREQLEQFRLLERGADFYAVPTAARLISVDVEADINRVCRELARREYIFL